MNQFTLETLISPVKDETGKWVWVLKEPLIWEFFDSLDNPDEIEIPEGFYTDLGSIPWYGRWLFNPGEPQSAAAYILHDWLLQLWGPHRQLEAAGVLYQALKSLDVPKWRRMVITLAVIAGIDRW